MSDRTNTRIVEPMTGGFIGQNYRRCLKYPLLILAVIMALSGLALFYAQQFTFDASADTLISKSDPELTFFRQVSSRFGDSPFLVLTYTPLEGPLLVAKHITRLNELEASLLKLDGVKSVVSILDAPLLKSPPIKISQMASGFNTLRKGGTVNLTQAKEELTSSPVFRELLISADGRSAMLRVDLVGDQILDEVRQQRDELAQKNKLNTIEAEALSKLEKRYFVLKEQFKERRDVLISEVRAIRDNMAGDARGFIGGVPMVAADIISFVRSDMTLLGLAVLILIMVSLWVFFRRLRWVLIPLGTTSITILWMIGLMGFLNQPATAISSNFLPILTIITISFTIHLIARYRELRFDNFSDHHAELVYETMRSKFAPSVYTALTTAVAFSSLLTSDIVPVIDFGWIMCVGVVVSLLVTYSFFASILLLLPKGEASVTINWQPVITRWFSRLTLAFPLWLIIVAIASFGIGLYGVSKLSLDNRFLDYFKAGTEIHDGMAFIDRQLGGTIPMDIIIQMKPFEPVLPLSEDDPFAVTEVDSYPEKYWYTPEKLHLLEKFHEYLDSREEIGKSVSLSSLEQVARGFTDGEPLDNVQLVAILNAIPDDMREMLITPYASPLSGELRISTRLHETGKPFSRNELIRDIKQFAVDELGLAPEAVHVTGVAVLFNNMLNQLFSSQTSTLMFVMLATILMFSILLRSPILGIVGLAPNLLAAITVLGFMGFAGIPLDMMTIIIAAIVIGIGVDDAIHYLHRYQQERSSGASSREAVERSHSSIGNALYFTTITVMAGFSVLSLSNFVPTIYFGLLTAMAMGLALSANLSILPALLLKIYR